jgi:large subunit ribosomal protein L13
LAKTAPPSGGPPASAAPAKSPVKPAPPSPARAPTGPPPSIVDASDLVLGRAASLIAKRLLSGESIVVVNAEKSVVTGARASVLETYRANRARGSVRSGPHFPRYPDRIFRRTVRGMLPHLKTRGRDALDRLEVYMGVPAEYQSGAKQTLDGAKIRPALRRPITLEEISRLLGARL